MYPSSPSNPKTRLEKPSQSQIIEAYRRADDARLTAFREMQLNISDLKKLGMREGKIKQLLKKAGLGVKERNSLVNDRFNQIKGEKLDGLFTDGKLDNVFIVKNSTLLYYMYSDEGEFIGMNNTLASSILIKFNENEISEVSFYRNPDGNVISENKIIVNEMKLPGFIWRENEKPESIDDLFSEADKKINIVEIE